MPQPTEFLPLSKAYWNAAANKYEKAFTGTIVGQMWRESVWKELDKAFPSGARVLELNCGTGIDAIHLARRGVTVLGCDISSRMIEIACRNAHEAGLSEMLDFQVLPTEQLDILRSENSFDGAFSNFSGLNCVDDLAAVSRDLACRLKPGAPVLLCMLGRIHLWERLRQLARGDLKKAFGPTRDRSVPSSNDSIRVKYPSRRKIERIFAPQFKLRRWQGIGIAVPPAYMESAVNRVPGLTQTLHRIECLVARLPVLRGFGACILLEFERTSLPEISPE
jgi:ubiquinone/menaquinone biosynthesis C-methylase UbiE